MAFYCLVCSDQLWVLTGTLGHTNGAILVLGVWVGLHFECVLIVQQGLRTLTHTGARIVEIPASLSKTT